jgi:hypothetical protein
MYTRCLGNGHGRDNVKSCCFLCGLFRGSKGRFLGNGYTRNKGWRNNGSVFLGVRSEAI